MASVACGTKRPFSAMTEEGNRGLHLLQDPGEGLPTRQVRLSTSAEGTPSMSSSTRTTPRNTPLPGALFQAPCEFQQDASIVLIGMRGTGKSTLAVIASIACRRRVVDIDDLFQEATGFSPARYRKQFGAANHNLRQEEILQTVLKSHDRHAIIVCNGGSLERNGQALVQEFARTHPVVHVVRDLHSISKYLGGVDPDRLKEMLAFSAPILRRCSNFEFYNISESTSTSTSPSEESLATPNFLTLKRTQRTFLKFLSLLTSKQREEGSESPSPSAKLPPLEPGYPLSDVPTELRTYTSAVQVTLDTILTDNSDIQALETGVDAVELVIHDKDISSEHSLGADYADRISAAISKLRRSTVVPIIYHAYRNSQTADSLDLYLDLVRHGLRTVPDFIVVDLSITEDALNAILASRGRSKCQPKVIGHLHSDTSWDEPYWIAQYDNAVRNGCALVRFTRPAESSEDDFPLQKLRHTIEGRNRPVPLACYNTGKQGRRSACFSKYLTPVQMPVDEGQQEDHHSEWITARQVTHALYASFIFDPMQIYIIGASLGYTVSPAMNLAAYDSCGLPHRFERVQCSSLNSLKDLVRNSNFGGSIIIQPFKIEVMSLVDALSPHARIIGAVNTLIPVRNLKDDGSVPTELELFQERSKSGPVQALYGDNTEWIGIRSCVRRGLSPANAVRPTTSGLVIGAGGMARAAIYALIQLGVKNIFIFNRTLEKAEKLAQYYAGRVVAANEGRATPSHGSIKGVEPTFHVVRSRDEPWDDSYRQPTIILSCIPADPIDGGPAAQVTLPEQWLRSPTGGVVMEMSYKTLNTSLMQQMREAGSMWTYMDGLDFIPEQAFAQFELFTGKRAPRRVMREEALRAWRDENGDSDPDMVSSRLKRIEGQDP